MKSKKINELSSKAIPFADDMLEIQLLKIVNNNKGKCNLYVILLIYYILYIIGKLAKSNIRLMFQLAWDHCKLNSGELICTNLKGFIPFNKTTFKIAVGSYVNML